MTVTQVFGAATGPVHASQPAPHGFLSVCGVGVRFRHTVRPGDLVDVTCPRCLRLIAKGQTRARGAR